MEDAKNQNKIVEMLQNQEQLAAIGQLIEENKAGLLNNLMSKGTIVFPKVNDKGIIKYLSYNGI